MTRLKIQPNLRRTEFFLKKKKKQKGTKRVVIEIPVSHAPWEAKQEVKMEREGEGEIEVKKEKKDEGEKEKVANQVTGEEPVQVDDNSTQ